MLEKSSDRTDPDDLDTVDEESNADLEHGVEPASKIDPNLVSCPYPFAIIKLTPGR